MFQLIYRYYSPNGLKKSKNLSNSSRLVIEEAKKFGVDWKIIPGTQIVELTFNGKKRSYYHQIPTTTTALAIYACNNKEIASNLLHQNGVSVPKGFQLKKDSTEEYLQEVFDCLKKPLVIKPNNGAWGENITTNIHSYDKYLKAIELAFGYSAKINPTVIVEEMFDGNEYRILASRDKVIGVLKRVPANVLGNGKSTIEKLILEKNKEEIRGIKGENKSHLKIRMDKKLKEYLEEQHLTLKSIPQKAEKIFLRRVSNISQGGDAIDFTDRIHTSVRDIALKVINTIPGLSFTGIDFMTKDITKPQSKDSYVVIEINDSPGFDIHDYPYQGKNRHAAREFLFLIFPELKTKML